MSMARRGIVDHALRLQQVPVRFLGGSQGEGTAEGNNAAWRCICGQLLVGRCYFQFGDTCHTDCRCGRSYRVVGDERKRAREVTEIRNVFTTAA